MEIEDAFTQEAIETASAELDGPDERKVRKVVKSLAQTKDEEWENIALFSFMAGRAYQEANVEEQSFPVSMDRATLNRFIQFLVFSLETEVES